MTSAICTLFEGNYHLGLAALVNSLCHSGFKGTIYCGYRGALPPWVQKASPEADEGCSIEPSPGVRLCFLPQKADVHFTNYKPEFMLKLLEGPAKDADRLLYLDPDIVVKCTWPLMESWGKDGIGLCEDVNACMPRRHPLRIQWREWLTTWLSDPTETQQDRYYSGGFVAIEAKNKNFLAHWAKIIVEVGKQLGSLKQLKTGSAGSLFHTPDQDALNIALMTHCIQINATGPEGMDFVTGGHYLSHAIGSRKPWNSSFILDALKGYPPSMAQKCFFDHVDAPIQVFSARRKKLLKAKLGLAAFIGRFYGRR